jgi:antitoxin (DNA-binding transcriptional repressor) of toxin-antitoxin stability system
VVDGAIGRVDDRDMRTSVRRSAFGAVLAGAAVLSACGGQPAASTAAPVSEAAATESPAVTPDDLRQALLPASAFGDDATVVGLSLEQLGQLPALAGLPQGTSIDQPLCGAALSTLLGSADDLPTLVATGAFSEQVRTLEVLADGPALEGLDLPVDQLLTACPTVTATGADGTVTTVSLAELPVPDDLGEARAGLQVTVTRPEGSVAALVGVVSQGSRALLLAQSGAAGVLPDTDGFTDLLVAAADAAATD